MTLDIDFERVYTTVTPSLDQIQNEERFENIYAVICKYSKYFEEITTRLEMLEKRNMELEAIPVSANSERAIKINDWVQEHGFLTRGQITKRLGTHIVATDRAIKEAISIFPNLKYFKNSSGKWIIAKK